MLDFVVSEAARVKLEKMREKAQKRSEGASFAGSHRDLRKFAAGGSP